MLAIQYTTFTDSDNMEYPLLVQQVIDDNMAYIYTFNPVNGEEIAREIFLKIVNNNRRHHDYTAYIKKLARTMGKKKQAEIPTEIYDKGDISETFGVLKETLDLTQVKGLDILYTRLRHLYLLNEANFHKLEVVFQEGLDGLGEKDLKVLKAKDIQLYSGVKSIVDDFGANVVFTALEKFLKDLYSTLNVQVAETIKEITLRKYSEAYLDKLPKGETIEDSNGMRYGICERTLLSEINPDYAMWTPISGGSSATRRVQKVDITPFMEYLYEEVFVDSGVKTKHISWCGGSYKLTTPSGAVMIDENREFFINRCRVELISALIKSNVGSILALSTDSVYFKGKALSSIKLNLQGKVLILPVETYTATQGGTRLAG